MSCREDKTPDGCVPLDGRSFNREEYPKLYDALAWMILKDVVRDIENERSRRVTKV